MVTLLELQSTLAELARVAVTAPESTTVCRFVPVPCVAVMVVGLPLSMITCVTGAEDTVTAPVLQAVILPSIDDSELFPVVCAVDVEASVGRSGVTKSLLEFAPVLVRVTCSGADEETSPSFVPSTP